MAMTKVFERLYVGDARDADRLADHESIRHH